jgi:hypothetical protein
VNVNEKILAVVESLDQSELALIVVTVVLALFPMRNLQLRVLRNTEQISKSSDLLVVIAGTPQDHLGCDLHLSSIDHRQPLELYDYHLD